MQQAPVLLDEKIAEIVLTDGRFAEIHRLRVIHVLGTESLSDFKRAVKIMMNVVKIDGKEPTLEDILTLDLDDFNNILKVIFKCQ